MKPEEFFSVFEKEGLLPLYYLYGDDRYLRAKAVQLLLGRREKPDQRLNVSVYAAKSLSVSTIIDDARTLPFLCNRRVILVKEAEKLSPAGEDALLPYLKAPTRTTSLVFLAKELRVSGEFLNALKKNGLVQQLRSPFARDIPDWVRYLAKALDKSFEPVAIELLRNLTGNDLQTISGEIEKLALFVGNRKSISRGDIETAVSQLKVESIFEFVDYIGNRSVEKALTALTYLLESGESHARILAMITRHFRMLLKARILLDQGSRPEKARGELNLQTFIWEKLFSQVQKFSQEDLESDFQRLWKTDALLKSRRLPADLFLECLVLNLCG